MQSDNNILLYPIIEGGDKLDRRTRIELVLSIMESTVLHYITDKDRYLDYSAFTIKNSLLEIKKFLQGKKTNELVIIKGITLRELPAVLDLVKSVKTGYGYQFICIFDRLDIEDLEGTYFKNDIDFLFSTIEGIKIDTDPQFLTKKLKGVSDGE